MTARRRITINESKPPPKNNCLSTPTVYHAAVVIFLEYFAFGLLTTPMITVLDETFPSQMFLMNGIIQGVKGFLSFLSAPLLGALSDGIGRKPFLLLTVTFTCCPIPLMKISHWWYFTMTSISGIFSVTFSVVLAYVADITSEDNRSWGYGLVSATFAASLVTSPAIGAYLGQVFGDKFVIALATAVAFLDIFFIMAFVPESLPEKVRASHICSSYARAGSPNSGNNNKHGSGASKISWDMVDPFAALRKITNDHLVLIVCITTFFSYLPEAGQYSCFFVYLRLVMGFSEENVALFIAFGGILSCVSQTLVLTMLNQHFGAKRAIIVGLTMEAIQLALYGFSTQPLLLWLAGLVAAMGTVTYPALSAFVSKHAEADQQGVVQGLVAGIRGLCGGLGPALFGLIFYVFRVDLHKVDSDAAASLSTAVSAAHEPLRELQERFLPGPPFAFGAVLVLIAILVSCMIPESPRNVIDGVSSYDLLPGAPGSEVMATDESNRIGRLRRHHESLRGAIDNLDGNRVPFTESKLCEDKMSLLSRPELDSKLHHPPSSCSQTAVGDPGLLGLLLHGWRDTRRPPRLFRNPPTVSFTKARFVEPLRRLLGGLSGGPTAVDKTTSSSTASPPDSHCDFSGQKRYSSSAILRHYAEVTSAEADAADLSNYRNYHGWRGLLPPATLHSGASVGVASGGLPQSAALQAFGASREFSDSAGPHHCCSSGVSETQMNRFDGGTVNRAFASRDETLDTGLLEGHHRLGLSSGGLYGPWSHSKLQIDAGLDHHQAATGDAKLVCHPAVVVQHV